MELNEILELLAKKYPSENSYGVNPFIIIFNDGSGRIVSDAIDCYATRNCLFSFDSLEELVEHLQGEKENE